MSCARAYRPFGTPCCQRPKFMCSWARTRLNHSPCRSAHQWKRLIVKSAEDPNKSAEAEAGLETLKGNEKDLQLPRDVIERLRNTVFGFDTFFVTSVENYEADGVLFKGNLRGNPATSFAKMRDRLKNELGLDHALFLLEDKEGKPVVAVFPASFIVPQDGAVAPVPVAVLFALVTLVTTLNACGVPFLPFVLGADVNPLDPQFLSAAVPGTLATMAILAAHEVGHQVAAKKEGAELAPPFLIPAGLGIIGSFGGITSIRSTLPNRAALLSIASAGPAAGTAVSLACVVVGLLLTLTGVGGGAQVESIAFNDSLIMGALGKAVFGDALVSNPTVTLHPIFLAGWAGLVINGLNLIPMGELDGARIAHSVWGRRPASLINAVLVIVVGICGIFDTLALYWILLVLTLQRGPIQPQQEELTAPTDSPSFNLGLALLFLPLLSLLPYPGDLTSAGF